MLHVPLIKKLFQALNKELARINVIGEIGICGGAVMCLVYQARAATKDVNLHGLTPMAYSVALSAVPHRASRGDISSPHFVGALRGKVPVASPLEGGDASPLKIDAIFEPTKELRKASAKIAKDFGLDSDWLNDAAKTYFHVDPPREEVMQLSHLRIWAPKADYMLAMKCIAARFDTHDLDDVKFLIQYLELKNPESVFKVISQYYPHDLIPPKTQFLVEELFPQNP